MTELTKEVLEDYERHIEYCESAGAVVTTSVALARQLLASARRELSLQQQLAAMAAELRQSPYPYEVLKIADRIEQLAKGQG